MKKTKLKKVLSNCYRTIAITITTGITVVTNDRSNITVMYLLTLRVGYSVRNLQPVGINRRTPKWVRRVRSLPGIDFVVFLTYYYYYCVLVADGFFFFFHIYYYKLFVLRQFKSVTRLF